MLVVIAVRGWLSSGWPPLDYGPGAWPDTAPGRGAADLGGQTGDIIIGLLRQRIKNGVGPQRGGAEGSKHGHRDLLAFWPAE